MKKINVLLVEDNKLSAQLTQELLSQAKHFNVRRVETLTEARPLLSDNDVIVLDLYLPDSEGLETLREVRRLCDTPVVALTSEGRDEVAREALTLGAQDFLVKGLFDRHHLNRAITYAIERGRRKAEPAVTPPAAPARPANGKLALAAVILSACAVGAAVAALLALLVSCLK
jgi:DNA-binding response OmpR family regulator